MRSASIIRQTAETNIKLQLDLDSSADVAVNTGVGFLDHMLTLFAHHGRFCLNIQAQGDTHVDDHHLVEDVGICLGQAFAQAMGDMRGITRYGNIVLPMDEALVLCAVDICGRSTLRCYLDLPSAKVGSFDTELVEEFLLGFTRNARLSLHLRQLDGSNTHHIIEACFKALGRVMRAAVNIDPLAQGSIPSTKGAL